MVRFELKTKAGPGSCGRGWIEARKRGREEGKCDNDTRRGWRLFKSASGRSLRTSFAASTSSTNLFASTFWYTKETESAHTCVQTHEPEYRQNHMKRTHNSQA
eukprot:727136-Rhodomonas_salina.2